MKIDFFGTYEQAENMVKMFDKLAIYYYNVFGCKRIDSFYNRETKNHYIRIAIPDYIYKFIRSGFLSELSGKFQKDIEILNDTENGEKRVSIMIIN